MTAEDVVSKSSWLVSIGKNMALIQVDKSIHFISESRSIYTIKEKQNTNFAIYIYKHFTSEFNLRTNLHKATNLMQTFSITKRCCYSSSWIILKKK